MSEPKVEPTAPYDRLLQSKTQFYVCVRLRDSFGGDPWLVERIVAGGGPSVVIKALTDAIDKYGPTHKCVIEPVETTNFFGEDDDEQKD
jgi:hypothetical protein